MIVVRPHDLASWIVAWSVAVASCQSSGDESDPRNLATLPAWSLPPVPTTHIGVVDGDPDYQFFNARSAVRLHDGTIVVANTGTAQLRFYDATGEFIRAVGGRGGGPGEFRSLKSVYLTGDSLMAYDETGRKSFFDRDGTFLGSANVDIGGERPFPMDTWLYRRNWVDGVPDVTEDRHRVARVLDRLPTPDSAPGYHLVRVDRPGNIWLADDVTDTHNRTQWTVHDTAATPIARVTLPDRFEMLEITDRDILGRWRDESDVEFIRVYELQKPAGIRRATRPAITDSTDAPPITPDQQTMADFRSVLRNAVSLQERYWADHRRYTANRHDLAWDLPEETLIDFISAGPTGWVAVVVNLTSPVICGIGLGGDTPAGWPEGVPICAETAAN